MNLKRTASLLLVLGIFFIPQNFYAQQEEEVLDPLGNVSDNFQEHFFEALKQKGIENYDKALVSLEKAMKEAPNEAVIYFEIAKNFAFLKQWEKAEQNYKKALSITGEKVDIYEGLYDVYYNTKEYNDAIETVIKLIPFDKDYKEDLATLYERTEQYDQALQILDELDLDNGYSDYRNQLRQQIYSKSDDTGTQITDLETRINRPTATEQDFLNLIYLYSNQGNETASFETAKKLLAKKPDSQLAHLALYKFYLEENNSDEGIESLKKVLYSQKIDQQSKLKVLNDFINYVKKHPAFEATLQEVVNEFSEQENNPKIFEQLGNYYIKNSDFEQALYYFENGLKKNPTDFVLIKNTILLQLDLKKYPEAVLLSETSLDFFPSQPLLYLLHGVAKINLEEYDTAKSMLETGLDYLIDDPKMESDFYLQLSLVYEKQGDSVKSKEFLTKAEELLKKE